MSINEVSDTIIIKIDSALIKFFINTFFDAKIKYVKYISKISDKILINATMDLPDAN